MRKRLETLPRVMFFSSLAVSIYLYGVLSHEYDLFPFVQLRDALRNVVVLKESVEAQKILYKESIEDTVQTVSYFPHRLSEGLVLVMGVADGNKNIIRVIDRAGSVIYELYLDWFKIWGSNEGDFPEDRRPKSAPGSLLHGIDLLENGDVVVNFEHLSTMRVNLCGEVIWKLDNLGHHSVHAAEDGTIWVSAETLFDPNSTDHPKHDALVRSWTLQRISQDGEILETIPVIKILRENDLEGLLRISSISNDQTEVRGDILHLNDIETFSSNLRSEIFEPGDLMFSLRNLNTVIVVDADTQRIKFRSTGEVLRQHDPDFMDGDLISIFDNYNLMPTGGLKEQSSRIVEIDARTGRKTVVLDGAEKPRFFTAIMGTHQRLPNGNFLINSSAEGRVMEVLADGSLAWAYTNKLESGSIGRLTMAMLLPPHMNTEFFATQQARCRGSGPM